jgi:hypothetical protein
MKKYLIIFTLFFGVLLIISSCTKDDTEPRINLNDIKAPVMSLPAGGGQYILTRATADSIFDHFVWSQAEYSLSTIPESLYAVECAPNGTDFLSVFELASTTELSIDILQGKVNEAIVFFIGGDFPDDTVVGLQFRIKATINANNVSDATNTYSEDIASEVTPFPLAVEAPPLYLVGDATSAGWEPNSTLQFLWDTENEWHYIITTLEGGTTGFKALEVQGEWQPQWGTNDAGTWEGGTLVGNPADQSEDPTHIPAPAETGDYMIIFDIGNRVYSVELADIATTMHIIGDATEAGWNNADAIPMVKVGTGKFELVANLNADAGEGFKFLVDQGAWAPMYGTVEDAAFESGVLVYRETEADPDPKSLPPPPSTGPYLIEMDIMSMIYSVTPQ